MPSKLTLSPLYTLEVWVFFWEFFHTYGVNGHLLHENERGVEGIIKDFPHLVYIYFGSIRGI